MDIQPKSSMCAVCKFSNRDCSKLPFNEMPILKTYSDGTKAVKCSEFKYQKNYRRTVNDGHTQSNPA
jgi:hypothetical protein